MGIVFDIVLMAILLIFVVSGIRRGFVRSLLELAGCIASLVLSARFSGRFLAAVEPYLGKSAPGILPGWMLHQAFATAVLFILFEVLVQVIVSAADHLFRLPILRQMNALLGGIFGFLKGAAVLLLICAVTRLALPAAAAGKPGWGEIRQSRIYQYAASINPVYPLLQAYSWNGVNGDAEQKQKL